MKKYRVICGGSWDNDQQYARCTYRYRLHPDYFDDSLGFRVIKRRAYATKTIYCGSWTWSSYQKLARCAYRNRYRPDYFSNYLGFRVIKRE